MKKHQLAAGIALASSMLAAPVLNAASNPFSHTELQSGFNYNESPVAGHEGKCGGEGKCGEGMKEGEGHDPITGGETKCPEGKCGEGKCGGDKAKEGKCGGDK